MDEIAKSEARNYVAMGSFILLGIFSLLHLLNSAFSSAFFDETEGIFNVLTINLILGGLVLILGIALAVLGKRGLTTIFIFTEGLLILIGSLIYDVETIGPVLIGVNIVLAILMLFGADGKKLVYFLLALLAALVSLSLMFGWPSVLLYIFFILQCAIYVWCAFCCGAERTGFPGRNLICEDESIEFKTSGSVIGYLLFAMVAALWAVYYLLSSNFVALAAVQAGELLAGLMLIFVGILLFAIAKMRFTPVIFILVGALFAISPLLSGVGMFVFGGAFIVLGIIALLRNESRVLLALFLILYGLTAFISVAITGNYSLGIFHAILNLIPCLVALYLGFAVFSQNKRLLI